MSTEGDDDRPSKRPRMMAACLRCRRRKQKCDDCRPCSNCARSGEKCLEVPISRPQAPCLPITYPPSAGAAVYFPLMDDFTSLADRVCQLEEQLAATLNPDRAALDSADQGQERPDEQSHSPQFHRNAASIGLLAAFFKPDEGASPGSASEIGGGQSYDAFAGRDISGGTSMDAATETALWRTYYDKIQCGYPFLRPKSLRELSKTSNEPWVGFFVNMVFSVTILVSPRLNSTHPAYSERDFFRIAVTRYLSHVFAHPDRILHIQAYLLLAMHALHSPSTEHVVSIASATMRYCVMAQLHLAETEPVPVDPEAMACIQLRRRIFWSAYVLDRAVGTMFDLPFSIPDYQITVQMYANIDDGDLDRECRSAFPSEPASQSNYTGVSSALHIVYCRQIQSEILNMTMHRDFDKHFDRLSNWRRRTLDKLDRWKSLCHRYTDQRASSWKSHEEWLHMIYNFSLAMLYSPNKHTVAGPAGDWTVKSCIQAILIYRKFQRQNAGEAWMALIAQFKCGVALLYCFFATEARSRSAAYDTLEASEAVRACSVMLSLLAERWLPLTSLRDAFDILAREVPLHDSASCPRQMRESSAAALTSLLPKIEPILVHRKTLRMIKEMTTGLLAQTPAQGNPAEAPDRRERAVNDGSDTNESQHMAATRDVFQPLTPNFFWHEMPSLDDMSQGDFDYATLGFPGVFDPEMSFMPST